MVFEKSLTAMVKGIRAHRGKETEYISACMQEIQKEVKSSNLATKSMAVLKLAYLNMLGYDMSFANFAVVEVMSHNRFAVKRPGYLGAALCFNDSTDVGLLTINLFKRDMKSKSQYDTGLAVSCMSSICTTEISRDLVDDLLKTLSSTRAYLRKKTVLCLYRVFVKDPQQLRTCFPKLKERLGDEDQGVLTGTVNTFLELARKNARNYLSLVPQLYHLLTNTTNNWLSIKLLKLFQLLCPLEPRLPSKMVEPLTSLLNTTKAQSVEFEAIRCTIRVMPEGTAVMALAIEKLQAFLNSSDRNLRFIALALFREILEKPAFKEKYPVKDLHEKVLTCIEESDTTARKVALQLLDLIVSPQTLVDAVKKLMEFSKTASTPDEFIGTIIRIGARDRYGLVEDFAWYLLVLAEISRNMETAHSGRVAEQFIDVAARVPQVRPYAVTLALGLIDRSTGGAGDVSAANEQAQAKESMLAIATPMVGACAWVIGEYSDTFEAPKDVSFIKAASALLSAKSVQTLEPTIQTCCIWAATKLYLSSGRLCPGATEELHGLLMAQLPTFARSTHVDVSERAGLGLDLASFLQADTAAVAEAAAGLFEGEPLLPVHPDAQRAVPEPPGLDLNTPFFPPEPDEGHGLAPRKVDPTDPYNLAAAYKDDLGLLTAASAAAASAEGRQQPPSAGAADSKSSIFYLGTGTSKDEAEAASSAESAQGGGAGAGAEAAKAPAPLDPLEQMRERLMASRAGGTGPKYEVLREELTLPGAKASAAPAPPGGRPAGAAAAPPAQPASAAGGGAAAGAAALPLPAEKELLELQSRLWSVLFQDEHIGIYACLRSKNGRKQLLRVDLRCERLSEASGAAAAVSDVRMRLPAGAAAQEADASGLVPIALGALATGKAQKAKLSLSLVPFLSPRNCSLDCQVQYSVGSSDGESSSVGGSMALQIPCTTFLEPSIVTEDDVASYITEHSTDFLGEQTAQVVSLTVAGGRAPEVGELPALVGRCCGICRLHGIQQQAAPSAPAKGQKFLLVALPPSPGQPGASGSSLPGQEALPAGARIICLCNCTPREAALDVRVTVKSCHKEVCDDVCSQLIAVFRELVEGRLKAAPPSEGS